MIKLFGYNGTNDKSNKLINKNQIPPETEEENEYVQQFLTNISDNITLEEFTSAIKKWCEQTTTSPSGCHLGHFK
jgi:hypothetical protein